MTTTHRIDDYPGSVDTIAQVETINDSDHKERLIVRYEKNGEILKYLALMNRQFLDYTTASKGIPYVPMTLPQYKDILLGKGNLPKGFSVTTAANFFETRALIGVGENACLNKVDGLGYPKLSYQPTAPAGAPPPPPVSQAPSSVVEYSAQNGVNIPVTDADALNIGITAGRSKIVEALGETYTTIETRTVTVSPQNIQTVNGNTVVNINSGGTQTSIRLSDLKPVTLSSGAIISVRDQVLALSK